MRRSSSFALFGVAVLVVATALAVVLRTTSACAAPFPPAAAAADRTGRATFYGNAAPGGACSFPTPPADHLTTAAGPADYAAAAACGGYLEVTGARGTIQVKVDNLCPECEPGHLDLSTEAFARLDDPVKGIVPISFHQVVDPPLSSGLTFRVKEGSSQWWLALLVDQHGNPLRSVEVRADGGSWRALKRTGYNYWLAEGGAGAGPFQVRVTDVRGKVAVAQDIAVRPGEVQRTSVRLNGPGSSGGSGTTDSGGSRTTSGPTTKAAPGAAAKTTRTTAGVATRTTSGVARSSAGTPRTGATAAGTKATTTARTTTGTKAGNAATAPGSAVTEGNRTALASPGAPSLSPEVTAAGAGESPPGPISPTVTSPNLALQNLAPEQMSC